ncbi:monofunctional C1-tetrahydrofolate synthase, mitochondrial [Latimeria chalumnae]
MRLSMLLRGIYSRQALQSGTWVSRFGVSALPRSCRPLTQLPFGSWIRTSSGSAGGSPALRLGKEKELSGNERQQNQDGVTREILQRSKEIVTSLQKQYTTFKPVLAIIQAGGDDLTLEMNKNFAEEIGLNVIHICLPQESNEEEILDEILKLNEDPKVHGIALHLPANTQTHKVLTALNPEKDIDGVTDANFGKLVRGESSNSFMPPLATAAMKLLEKADASITGKKVLIVGANGPLEMVMQGLIQKRGAMTMSCQWNEEYLQTQLHQMDIVLITSPKPQEIPDTWLRHGSILHCSHAFLLSGNIPPKNICKTFEEGVRPLAVALRMQNVVESSKRWICRQQYKKWNLRNLKLQPLLPVPSDIEISRGQTAKAVEVLAKEIGLLADEIEVYGHTKAKVRLSLLERLKEQPDGKYVLVAGITPTPLGEGKSTVTVGLAQALTAHLKMNSFACLRQPSQGPTFGVKGGAAGGGYAQVIPMEEFNLHLTGDIHAITAANNLLAAAIDARILHEATQSDKALYNRLVPLVNGVRQFSSIQLARLKVR